MLHVSTTSEKGGIRAKPYCVVPCRIMVLSYYIDGNMVTGPVYTFSEYYSYQSVSPEVCAGVNQYTVSTAVYRYMFSTTSEKGGIQAKLYCVVL